MFSALELDSLKIKVDCVYSRLLLVHLADPVSASKTGTGTALKQARIL